MRRAFALLAYLAISVTVYSQNSVKPSGGDQSMILAMENAWNQAELHHDAKAADAILADTFISVDHHGQLENKAQYLAGLRDVTFNPQQISNTDTTVYVYGDTAIVTSAYRTKGTDGGKPFAHHGRFTDTWVKLNGSWKCVANQETLIRE
jgi:ketosteroid isomerase-like protein